MYYLLMFWEFNKNWHNFRFSINVLRDLSIIVAGGILFSYGDLATAGGMLISGTGFFSLFVLLHECSHQNGFRSKKWNNLTGHMIGALCLNPYTGFCLLHRKHHANLNHLQKDPTWQPMMEEKFKTLPTHQQLSYLFTRIYGFWLSTWFYILTRECSKKFHENGRWGDVKLGIWICLILHVCIFVPIYCNFGLIYLVWYIGALTVFHAIYSTITYLHHSSAVSDDLQTTIWHSQEKLPKISETTCDIPLPWIFEWLFHNINRHIHHHQKPSLAFYDLEARNLSSNTDIIKMLKFTLNHCHLVTNQGKLVAYSYNKNKPSTMRLQ